MRHSNLVGSAALAACALLAPLARAQTINLSTGFMPDPNVVQGMAGGPVAANTVQQDCRGFIPTQPSHILTTPTGFRFLRVFAESPQDTTLMIRSVQQTWCADDTYGTNPGLDLDNLPPGRYDIYVGSYYQGRMAPFRLSLSELRSSVPTGAGGGNPMQPSPMQPQVPAPSSMGNLDPTLRPTGRPLNVPPTPLRPVSAMGRTNGLFHATGIRGEGSCAGWVPPAPTHGMMLRSAMPFLSVFVTSAADSTLIIRRPDGSLLCNDDRYGLNPGVQGSFPAGLYQIWVGSYREGENRPYRITATIDPSQHP